MSKLWGGRYTGVTDALMWAFNASIGFDRRLAAGGYPRQHGLCAGAGPRRRAHRRPRRDALLDGLQRVADEFAAGAFACAAGDEDIHTAVERRLGELVGPVAGKLHTGRSRNDQVATDMRLYLLEALDALDAALRDAAGAPSWTRPSAHLDVLMPGYTHLQPAQPVRFSHWLLSFFWMLERDRERLRDLLRAGGGLPAGGRGAGRQRLWRRPRGAGRATWALTASPRTAWTRSPTAT